MAEKVVAVRLEARVDGAVAGFRKAKSAVDDLTRAAAPDKAKAFESLANKAALAGTAVAAGIGVAINKFAEFDQTMSAVKANTGAAGQELQSLRDIAMKLGADTVFSAAEAAQGINEMAKAGVSTADILSGGLSGALDLAAAGQLEVGRSAEIAATAMNQFGLQGKDIPRIADALAAGANKAMGGVDDLASALEQVGPVANSMGWSLEETTGALAMFAQAGLVGEKGGTSLRGVLMSLTGPSKIAAEEMANLGIEMYDAQGKTMGAASMAQQLQNALKGLPDAERNAAMARIFGNASIGAATILMEGGAAAAQEWEAAVTDAGFAQAQAATLTDNLRGDLEQLGGAMDTVFIQTGGSANDSLRVLVQGLTGVVDVVSRIPGPVLLAGGALTSLALLAPKGVLMWKGYTAQLNSLGWSLDAIALKAPRAAAGLRAMGAAGAVIAGMSIAGAGLEGMWLDVAGANDEATKSLKAYLDGGREADGVTGIMRTGFYDLGASIEHAFGTGGAKSYLLGFLDEVGTGFGVFGPDKLTEATQFFSQIDEGLAGLVQSGNGDAAAELFKEIAAEAQAQGISLDGVKERLPQYATGLATAGDAAGKAADGTGKLTTETDRLEEAAADAEQALSDLLSAIQGLGSPVAEQRKATRDYEAAIDDMTKSIKENGKTLDEHTEKGRANQIALDAIYSSTLAKVAADYKVTESTKGTEAATKVATETMKKGRQAFIDAYVAAQGGAKGAKEKAEELATQLGLIPSEIPILVKQTGAEDAAAEIDKAAKDRYAKIIVREEIQRANVIKSRGAGPTGETARAEGGPIPGYSPSPTADNVPIWATAGEFMHRVAAVRKYGEGFMHAVNEGRFPAHLARGYATGGRIGYATGGAVASLTSADRSVIEALIRALTNPIRDLANATKNLNSATVGLKAPQSALARENADVARAQKIADADKARLDVAKKRQAAGQAEVTTAKKRLDQMKAARADLGLDKRALQARINSLSTAAKATKGVTKADLDLAAAKKQMERLNAQILKQDKSIQSQQAKVKTAQDKTAKSAAVNAAAVKAAQDKATKSAANLKAQQEQQKVAADRLKEAQTKLAEASAELARQQQAIADAAARVSDQFRDAVDGPGTNITAWIDRLKTGATDVAEFTKQVEQLRAAGLDELLVQQVIGAGVHGGSRVATNLLDAKSSIKDLNGASESLQKAADKLGLLAATGIGRYAGGGAVGGLGGVDKNLALLTRGEHVLDTLDVAAMGGQQAVYAFRKALHADPARLRAAPMGRPVVVQSAPIDYGRLGQAVASAIPLGDLARAMSALPAETGAAVRDGMRDRDRADRRDARARTA